VGDGAGDAAGIGPCRSCVAGSVAASLSAGGAVVGCVTTGEGAGKGVGEGVGAAISMPGIASRSSTFSGCEAAGCGAAARGRLVVLLGCAALLFGAFGFGLLAPGMLLISCPSCWASAGDAENPALRAKQSAERTSRLSLARKLRLNMIPLWK
jgi:hypothetical protein